MSLSRLEDFLADAREDGALDSSGAFTVQLRQLAVKLGRELVAQREGGYLLKVVQSAVAAGSEKIVINSGAKRVTVQFCGKGPSKS